MSMEYAVGNDAQAVLPSLWLRLKWWAKAHLLPRKPCNLERYAESERRRAGLFDGDSDYGGMMGPAIVKMIRQFSDEGHSGFSAGLAISIFEKLARFEPLSPLTGEDDEWGEPFTNEGTQQNRRCSHVFREGNGEAYDGEGRIWKDPDGGCYQNFYSRVPVTFPYTPKREYVDSALDPRKSED